MPLQSQAKGQKPQTKETRPSASVSGLTRSTSVGLQQGTIQRTLAGTLALSSNDILQLQRSIGNRAVSQLLARQSAGPSTLQRSGEAVPAAPIGEKGGRVSGELENRILDNKSGGKALPNHVRQILEPKLGTDLSHVKIHTGSHAVQLSSELNAKAFTYRNHIYYSAGQSPNNLQLTAHETVHTLQQGATNHVQRDTVAPPSGAGLAQRAPAQSESSVAQVSAQADVISTPTLANAPVSIQRWLNFDAHQLGDDRSTTLGIDSFFGTSSYLEIKKKLKDYESARTPAKQLMRLMELHQMAVAGMDRNAKRTSNTESKMEQANTKFNDRLNSAEDMHERSKAKRLKKEYAAKDKNAKKRTASDTSRIEALGQLTRAIFEEAPNLARQVTPDEMYVIRHSIPEHYYDSMLKDADKAQARTQQQKDYLSKFTNTTSPDKLKHLSGGSHVIADEVTNRLLDVKSNESIASKKNNLTPAEIAAIKLYTKNGVDYRYINASLSDNDEWLKKTYEDHMAPKKGEPIDPSTLESVKQEGKLHGQVAVSGLVKLPNAEPFFSYRGMGLTLQEFQQQYEKPDLVTMPAITSSSRHEFTAEQYARNESDKSGKVGVLVKMWVTKGKDIAKLSLITSEKEVVILPGAKFKKAGPIVQDDKVYKVNLTQVS